MEQSMSPSPMTIGQVGKLQELLAAGLRKGNYYLESRIAQKMLEEEGSPLVDEMIRAFRKYYRRALLGQRFIDWVTPIDADNVLIKMPGDDGQVKEIHLSRLNRRIRNLDALKRVYDAQGKTPADESDLELLRGSCPLVSTTYPYVTLVMRNHGRWGSAAFGSDFSRSNHDNFGPDWWIASK